MTPALTRMFHTGTRLRYDLTQVAPGIGSTWAGGADGMDLTSYLLTQLEVRAGLCCKLSPCCCLTDMPSLHPQDILSPHGVFYLVAIKQNKPLAILERLRTTSAGQLDGKVRNAVLISSCVIAS
jgi:hypothetical protein